MNGAPGAQRGCLRGLPKERGGKKGLGAPVGSEYCPCSARQRKGAHAASARGPGGAQRDDLSLPKSLVWQGRCCWRDVAAGLGSHRVPIYTGLGGGRVHLATFLSLLGPWGRREPAAEHSGSQPAPSSAVLALPELRGQTER